MVLKPSVCPLGHISAEADFMFSVVFRGHVLGSKYHLGAGNAIRIIATSNSEAVPIRGLPLVFIYNER